MHRCPVFKNGTTAPSLSTSNKNAVPVSKRGHAQEEGPENFDAYVQTPIRPEPKKKLKSTNKEEQVLTSTTQSNTDYLAKPSQRGRKSRCGNGGNTTRTVKSQLKQKEKVERQYMHLITSEESRSNSSRVENSEIHFDPTSGNISKIVNHVEENKSNSMSQRLEMMWQKEVAERTVKLTELRQLPIEKASDSKTYLHYLVRLRKEVQNFRLACAAIRHKHPDDDPMSDPLIRLRFLFGMPIQDRDLEHVPTLNGSDPVWLACLWSMKQMLEMCNEEKFVKDFKECRGNARWYSNSTQDKMFLVSEQTMSGYTTGWLMYDNPQVRAILEPLMPQSVIGERTQPYFPAFESFQGDERNPFQLSMSYDFYAVDASLVPQEHARYCKPQGSCYIVQDTIDIDGKFVRLIPDDMIRNLCFKQFEDQALMRPHNSSDYNEEYDELQSFMAMRQHSDTPLLK